MFQVLENEIFKFEENICDFEEDLNGGGNIPDDVRDTILTVIGMAKLLMAQKLTQFRELCYKNIVSFKIFEHYYLFLSVMRRKLSTNLPEARRHGCDKEMSRGNFLEISCSKFILFLMTYLH